jgi:hypothetical protein
MLMQAMAQLWMWLTQQQPRQQQQALQHTGIHQTVPLHRALQAVLQQTPALLEQQRQRMQLQQSQRVMPQQLVLLPVQALQMLLCWAKLSVSSSSSASQAAAAAQQAALLSLLEVHLTQSARQLLSLLQVPLRARLPASLQTSAALQTHPWLLLVQLHPQQPAAARLPLLLLLLISLLQLHVC